WKKGNRLAHRSGPVGGVGEVFAAVNMTDPTRTDYFVENVELDPNRRRTIKLTSTDGVLVGFASFVLEEANGATKVGYHVYSETVIPPARLKATTLEALRDSERAIRESSARRFHEELLALKALAEGR
ncbi:MAG TPA: hypothetical protein VFV33_27105, partial [Gemmatimonadaceae bacterium]|nr:hypothetical protein [Gemmatimonadaceae bacterium]